jgi:hypothetical protein
VRKAIDDLREEDLRMYPVWEFVEDLSPETSLKPVAMIPVEGRTADKLFGTTVRFNDGTTANAMIGCVDPQNSYMNEHFLTLILFFEGKALQLARYHDAAIESERQQIRGDKQIRGHVTI